MDIFEYIANPEGLKTMAQNAEHWTIEILEKGIQKSKVSMREKIAAQKRLTNSFPLL